MQQQKLDLYAMVPEKQVSSDESDSESEPDFDGGPPSPNRASSEYSLEELVDFNPHIFLAERVRRRQFTMMSTSAVFCRPTQPCSFGYDNVDEYGTKTYHKEQGNASNAKTGSFGYTDASGLFRRVNYVADAGGFLAQIDTNEPGTLPGASADAVFNSNPRPAGGGRYSSPYTAGAGFGGQGHWAG
ncbi:hypothetical protein HPB48_017843 [Haemaphysalis longicornis]|uniref:Cuticle protein n=1 Tax=Haemaphysalis longicornis TaxID=44386 RepID=A0A9J6G9T1_HAELO|nr:hypothetical protein HPB48_017843 [Haemaphysalis longicornis]